MKKENWVVGVMVLAVSCLTLLSCRISTEELARQVQEAMVERWVGEGRDIRVVNGLVLVSRGGNDHTGLITLSYWGESFDLEVEVVFDGRNFIWFEHWGDGFLPTTVLERQVQAQMIERWTSVGFEPDIASDLVLVHVAGNDYEGLITLFYDGEVFDLEVDVTFDGTNFIWHEFWED